MAGKRITAADVNALGAEYEDALAEMRRCQSVLDMFHEGGLAQAEYAEKEWYAAAQNVAGAARRYRWKMASFERQNAEDDRRTKAAETPDGWNETWRL